MQGALIERRDITAICEFIKERNEGTFDDEVADLIKKESEEEKEQSEEKPSASEERDQDFDETLKRILKTFIIERRASVSSAQAKHNVGYIKAKKIVDAMADRGYITKEDGGKPREVLLTLEDYYNIFGKE
jgi:DNA segregation ATPase FtsK/SpoIIIE and related proteins